MPSVKRIRTVALKPPSATGSVAGAAYTLWPADTAPRGAVVVLPDAGEEAETHFDLARAIAAGGLSCLCLDADHEQAGATAVIAAAAMLAPQPIGLWGFGAGGLLALLAAAQAGARAVVAVAPTGKTQPHEHLTAPQIPVLLLHADGDQQVPVEQSRELARHLISADSRLIVVAGGFHGSIDHDRELQATGLGFLRRALS
jgi:dienelactone hydrolase